MSLLNPADNGAYQAISHLRKAITSAGDQCAVLLSEMLRYPEWRVQLVGATAVAITRSTAHSANVWEALDRYSWISPQLAATAAIVDPDFLSKANKWLSRFLVTERETIEIEAKKTFPSEYYSDGPVKVFSALLSLCKEKESHWAMEMSATEAAKDVLACYPYRGSDMAVAWKQYILNSL